MIRILLIMPYKEIIPEMRTYLHKQTIKDLEIEIVHIYGTNADLNMLQKYNIVVARGITAMYIKKQLPLINVVEIPMTCDDIVTALNKSIESDGKTKTAIILPETDRFRLDLLSKLTGIDLQTYYVSTQEQVHSVVHTIRDAGITSIIGGLTVYNCCKEHKLFPTMLKTGSDAIKRTIHISINVAEGLKKEYERANLMTTILNSSNDAMLALDKNDQVIIANTVAEQLFQRDSHSTKSLKGIKINEVIPKWNQCNNKNYENLQDLFIKVNDTLILVHQTPIAFETQVIGRLLTLQNAEQIRDYETTIRKQMAHKGLTAKYTFSNLLGDGAVFQKCKANALKYSQTNSNVLIIGETGTGKELFAQSIHNASSRAHEPFVAVNCAAFPEQLLESELFGYSNGAFTGAAKGGKLGLFELAHKGTIFLDEIGEMPLNLQSKLLRVLQEKEIRRIGDDKVIPIDVRIISATNVNIKEKIKQKEFRVDLYYRINILNLYVPPLRNRQQDVSVLFEHFVNIYSAKSHVAIHQLTKDALDMLNNYPWYGNVRELRNFSERAVVLCEKGVIDKEYIQNISKYETDLTPEPINDTNEIKKNDEEKSVVITNTQTKDQLAKQLGISRTTLWRRLKENKN